MSTAPRSACVPWPRILASAFARIACQLVKESNKGTPRPGTVRQSADQVSELTTNRLSVYLRCLNALESAGVRTISSQALAEQFHLNAAQIRKDLAYFGEFGVRGVGDQSGAEFFSRHARSAAGGEAEECGSDGVAREPLVFPGPGRR